jgi:hypothetical protein
MVGTFIFKNYINLSNVLVIRFMLTLFFWPKPNRAIPTVVITMSL